MNRRSALAIAGSTTLTALAGCAGVLSGGSNESTTNTTTATTTTKTQGAISEVAIEGTKLVVSLRSNASVDNVNVIGPDGSPSLGSKPVPTGSTTIKFGLLRNISPGEHTVIAVANDESVGEAAVSIQPNVEIARIATGFQTEDVDWPRVHRYVQAYFKFKNTGNAPEQLTKITMQGVPQPWGDEATSTMLSLDEEHIDTLAIPPGETREVITLPAPFRGAEECGTTNPMTVKLFFTIGENLTKTYTLRTNRGDLNGDEVCKFFIEQE